MLHKAGNGIGLGCDTWCRFATVFSEPLGDEDRTNLLGKKITEVYLVIRYPFQIHEVIPYE